MFPLRLKELRENVGLSQKAFADRLNISQSTVGMWESGKREPNYNTTERIADYFDVSVDYLLGRTDDKNQNPGETNIKFDEFSYAMYNESRELSEDDKQRLLTFARMLKDSISEDEKTNGGK